MKRVLFVLAALTGFAQPATCQVDTSSYPRYPSAPAPSMLDTVGRYQQLEIQRQQIEMQQLQIEQQRLQMQQRLEFEHQQAERQRQLERPKAKKPPQSN